MRSLTGVVIALACSTASCTLTSDVCELSVERCGVEPGPGGSRYAAEVMKDHPIAYYRLGDPESARSAADAVLPAVSGNVLGNVAFGAPGAIAGDTAASFDGMHDQIKMGNHFGMTGTNDFSVEAWVKRGARDSGNQTICGKDKYDVSTGQDQGYLLYLAQGAAHFSRIMPPDMWDDAFALLPNTSGYIYLVGKFDSSRLYLYIDATQAKSVSSTQSLVDPDANFAIGASADSQYFSGTIDEVAVYDKFLSDDRIQEHFKAATTP